MTDQGGLPKEAGRGRARPVRAGTASGRCGPGPRSLLVIAALVLAASAAGAQQKRKVVRLEEIAVEGRIQKPQAFYILQRSNLNYESTERSESFLDRITDSVRKDPF